MADYVRFQATRATEPDLPTLVRLLRAAVGDATIGVDTTGFPTVVLKRDTPWTTRDIATAVTMCETAPAESPALTAQSQIDQWAPAMRGFVGAVVDELNRLRALLALPPLTDADLLATMKTRTEDRGNGPFGAQPTVTGDVR